MTKLATYSLNQVEQMYRNGTIGRADIVEYLRAWNAGPHFTQAVFADGSIRNFEPDGNYRPYPHLWAEFGVRA